MAADASLLPVLEDFHWADEMSCRLLAFIGRRLSDWPVLLAATAREEELADAPALQAALLDRFRQKYRGVRVDLDHLLRSLTFFDDAEAEAMPERSIPETREDVKAFFRTEAARLFREP